MNDELHFVMFIKGIKPTSVPMIVAKIIVTKLNPTVLKRPTKKSTHILLLGVKPNQLLSKNSSLSLNKKLNSRG